MSASRAFVGALVIVVGAAWLLDSIGVLPIEWDVVLPIVLIALGVALIAGSRRGSHPILIVAGVVLTIILASAPRVQSGREIREADIYRPQKTEDLRSPIVKRAGDLHLDLTGIDFLEWTGGSIRAHTGVGDILVEVPSRCFRVHASAGAGTIRVFGRELDGGLDARAEASAPACVGYGPSADLDLHTAVGDITVQLGRNLR